MHTEARSQVGPAGRWTLHEARAEDDEQLLDLFFSVFGERISLAHWRWKYQHAPVRGLLLRKEAVPVAFFGGMPRALQGPRGTLAGVQNGDVMVLPSERGVFTRQGALFQVAEAFADRMVGPGRPYAVDWGFPNERHARLGEKLGLYSGAGHMVTLTWSPQRGSERALWHAESELPAGAMGSVDALFEELRRDWPGHLVPVRDAARWQWRYLAHPAQRYRVVLLRRRWFGRPLCAVVLREHAGHVEWLDYVGSRAAIDSAVALARRVAARHGDKPLVALVSESIARDFGGQAATSQPAMPLALLRGSKAAAGDAPLWLMGGDTDFL